MSKKALREDSYRPVQVEMGLLGVLAETTAGKLEVFIKCLVTNYLIGNN